MGVRILYDEKEDMAALYDSTSDFAFGPVFYRGEDYTPANERAENYCRWLGVDARTLEPDELENKYIEWLDAGEPGEDDSDEDAS